MVEDNQGVGPEGDVGPLSLEQAKADPEMVEMRQKLEEQLAAAEGQPDELAQPSEDVGTGDVEETVDIEAEDSGEGPEGQPEPEPEGDDLILGKFKSLEALAEAYQHSESSLGRAQQDKADLLKVMQSVGQAPTKEAPTELTEEQQLAKLADFASDPDGYIERKVDEREQERVAGTFDTSVQMLKRQALKENPDLAPFEKHIDELLADESVGRLHMQDAQGKMKRISPVAAVQTAIARALMNNASQALLSAKKEGMEAGEEVARKKAKAAVVGGETATPTVAEPKTRGEIDKLLDALPPDERLDWLEKHIGRA